MMMMLLPLYFLEIDPFKDENIKITLTTIFSQLDKESSKVLQ